MDAATNLTAPFVAYNPTTWMVLPSMAMSRVKIFSSQPVRLRAQILESVAHGCGYPDSRFDIANAPCRAGELADGNLLKLQPRKGSRRPRGR